MKSNEPSRGLIIIPSFNEAESLPVLVAEIRQFAPTLDFLIVNDASTDQTLIVAEKLGSVVTLNVNLGIGGAVQTGIKWAKKKNYDFCIQVDGDGQHDPRYIQQLIYNWVHVKSDMVIGSRFLHDSSFKSTLHRRLGIRIISRCIKLLYGKEITDPTSGFRLINRTVINLFSEQYPVDFPEPISIGMLLERKLRVLETAVEMRPREFGKSSISGIKPIFYMLRVLGYLVINRLGGLWS